jgi:predicted enzyme related to lactoylglutathione lyase
MNRVLHFELHVEDPNRAVKFYQTVFGWEIDKWKGPMDYWILKSGDNTNPGIDGGMTKRQSPSSSVVNYIAVASADEYSKKVKDAGGKILQPKMTVPGLCQDTEGITFGIIQPDMSVK